MMGCKFLGTKYQHCLRLRVSISQRRGPFVVPAALPLCPAASQLVFFSKGQNYVTLVST